MAGGFRAHHNHVGQRQDAERRHELQLQRPRRPHRLERQDRLRPVSGHRAVRRHGDQPQFAQRAGVCLHGLRQGFWRHHAGGHHRLQQQQRTNRVRYPLQEQPDLGLLPRRPPEQRVRHPAGRLARAGPHPRPGSPGRGRPNRQRHHEQPHQRHRRIDRRRHPGCPIALRAAGRSGKQQLRQRHGRHARERHAHATRATTPMPPRKPANPIRLPGQSDVSSNSSGGRSVWWRWKPPSDGNVTIDTRGSYFDTTLAITPAQACPP